MAPNGYDRTELETPESREIVRQQLLDMQAAVGEADFIWDSEDPADYNLVFVPGRMLVDRVDVEDLETVFRARGRDLSDVVQDPAGRGGDDGPEFEGTLTFELSDRVNQPARQILKTVQTINETPVPGRRPERGPMATLEHWVHVAANGDGHSCPATEPRVPGSNEAFPFPPAVEDDGVGKGVEVVVIDTGYVSEDWEPGDPLADLPVLYEYDGHGSFIEAVIKSRAPGVNVRYLPYPVHPASQRSGGVVSEYLLADLLGQALDLDPAPDIINISGGCHRIDNLPFQEFQRQWLMRSEALRAKVAVIAAAGNDRSPDPFFPAANDFAIGVGSLDKTGAVSYFSNYRQSGDVYVLGRNHVNKFPDGRYTCRWRPHQGEIREFTTGWAEWSGTSFAAPLFAGLVAAKMRQGGPSARQLADALVLTADWRQFDPPYDGCSVIAMDSPLY